MAEHPPEWTKDASCLGLADRVRDPWFPTGDKRERNAQYAQARTICQTCPVRLPCARYGIELLARDQAHGMFGGLTPGELRTLARQLDQPARKQARHGTRSAYVAGCRCRPCRDAHRTYEHERRIGAVAAEKAVAA